jgi:hypothetical protein
MVGFTAVCGHGAAAGLGYSRGCTCGLCEFQRWIYYSPDTLARILQSYGIHWVLDNCTGSKTPETIVTDLWTWTKPSCLRSAESLLWGHQKYSYISSNRRLLTQTFLSYSCWWRQNSTIVCPFYFLFMCMTRTRYPLGHPGRPRTTIYEITLSLSLCRK